MNKKGKVAILAIVLAQSLFVSPAQADTIISGKGKDMFQIHYFDEGQGNAFYSAVSKDEISSSAYTLATPIKEGFNKGVEYWADILADGSKNIQPLQLFVGTYTYKSADTFVYSNDYSTDYIKKALQNGHKLGHVDPDTAAGIGKNDPTTAVTSIRVGQGIGTDKGDGQYGFYADGEKMLEDNDAQIDIVPIIRHEVAHGLGIAAKFGFIRKNSDYKKEPTGVYEFGDDTNDANSWNAHLIDQYGNKAKAGMQIMTTNEFNILQADDPNLQPSDYFLVDAEKAQDGTSKGRAFFVGENVSQVLNGATINGVNGLPVNAWEKHGEYVLELSHIELDRSLMSHQKYRNYTCFMEAELAAMQDMGYTLDRRNYFGYSVYGSGWTLTNANGYSARNAEGTAYLDNIYNSTPLGMGLHVYGSNNNITQTGNIMTNGIGAVGIRVDGTGNTITVATDTNIYADGKNGIGILTAYGKNQNIIQYGTVTASGENGNGVQFDFGSNSYSPAANGGENRGSYVLYYQWENNTNLQKENVSELGIDGPMGNYTLYGSLTGKKNALYISKNAFVDNVNIMSGATINGNITSDWTHFQSDEDIFDGDTNGKEKLVFNYNGKQYAYDQYIPALVTKLNINGDLDYAGNINGWDNIRLNVNSGVMNYTGTANVINVEIAKGASLLGSGTYTVNDLSADLASGFSNPKMGKVINHGIMGATTGDVNISGKLVSDGNIDVVSADNGSRVYLLNVGGTADITDNNLVATEKNKPFLQKKYNYLNATEGITGNILASKLSDYVTAIGSMEGNNAFFTASQTKALGDTTGLNDNERSVAHAFDNATPNLMAQENQTGQQAANVFYNNAVDMKKLINSVTSAERTKLLGQTPMSNLTANSIYGRLDTNAFDGMLGMPVQVPSLDGENKTVNTNVPMTLDANNNFWLKMFRGFEGYGGIDGESDLNNQSFGGVVGYDRAVGHDARLGGFFAYGKTNYSADYLNGNSSDWRFGFYGDKRNGDWEYQGFVSYGANHYDLDSYMWNNSTKLNNDFKAKIWDVGLKAKYTIPSTKEKTWKIRPYGELGYTHTNQDDYIESGNSAFAKNMDSASNNSTRAELGVEFKRRITPTSGWGGSIGYKRILSGVNPELNGTFVGGTDSFTVKTENDRNYLTYNLNAYTSLGGKWTGQAEIRGEKSSNNHKEVYSVSAKYHF